MSFSRKDLLVELQALEQQKAEATVVRHRAEGAINLLHFLIKRMEEEEPSADDKDEDGKPEESALLRLVGDRD